MAYLEELRLKCTEPHCNSRAVVKVKDRFNSDRGNFCRKHGQKRVEELKTKVKAKDVCLVEALNILMNSPVRFKDTEARIEEVLKDNK